MRFIRGFSPIRWKRPPEADSPSTAATLPRRAGIFAFGSILMLTALIGGCATRGAQSGASLCPGTPAGIPVDADGCPLYSDADAVPDYLDRCPDTAPGVAVDVSGCPRDGDSDGVVDGTDACSDTPTGARVDAMGCSLTGERIAIVTNVNFDFDQSKVREDVRKRLGRVVQLLKEMPGIDVNIVGYTDNVGPEQYNLALSLRRAESVRDYVVAEGIDAERLSVAGRGMSEPIVSNATPEGRAVNRRVEFVVR